MDREERNWPDVRSEALCPDMSQLAEQTLVKWLNLSEFQISISTLGPRIRASAKPSGRTFFGPWLTKEGKEAKNILASA